MANVPVAEQTVFPGPYPTPTANAADFGSAIGEQYRYGAGQVEQGANDIAKIALERQQLVNQATAQDTDVKFQTDLGTLENQYFSLQGKDAADAYPKFQADVLALRKQYIGSAPNPVVQQMIGSSVSYSINRSLWSAGKYAGQETRQWAADSASGRLALLTQAAVDRATDSGYWDTVQKTIPSAVKNLADASGWSPEHAQAYADDLIAKTAAARQERLLKLYGGFPVGDRIKGTVGPDNSGAVGGDAYISTLFHVESADGKNMGVRGNLAQGDADWWDRFGPGLDPNKREDNITAVKNENAVNIPGLTDALGRKPTNGELYLAHQQGLAGAIALLKADPNAPAASVVPPENIAGNVPAGMDPKTVSAADFVAQWVGPFQGSEDPRIGGPANVGGNPVSAIYNAMDDATKARAVGLTLKEWDQQAAAARAQTNFEQQQAIKAKQAQLDQTLGGYFQQMYDHALDPSKPTPNLLEMGQDPVIKGNDKALNRLIAFSEQVNKLGGGGSAGAKMVQGIVRDIASGKITSADQIRDLYAPPDGSGSPMSRADYAFAMKQFNDAQTPEGKTVQQVKQHLFRTVEPYFESALATMGTQTLDKYAYEQAVDQAVDAARAKGPDEVRKLFDATPGNKNYVGSPAFVAPFIRNKQDVMMDLLNAGQPAAGPETPGAGEPAAPAVPSSYKTLADLQAAVKAGKVLRASAVEYARQQGWIQ